MGESENGPLKLHFDGQLRLEFKGAKVTTDAGLLAVRELDEALRLTDQAGELLSDSRTGKNTRNDLAGLLCQSVYARLAGYEGVNDQGGSRQGPGDEGRRRSGGAFSYRAASWNKYRRVVAKVEWHAGELFPRLGFIVTNLRREPSNVTRFYNKRGLCEQHKNKEGKLALFWTRLSSTKFISNFNILLMLWKPKLNTLPS